MIVLPIDEELSLRQARAENAEELFALIEQNRDHLARWVPWVPAITSVDDERAFLRMSEEQWAVRTDFVGILTLSGKAIGTAGLDRIDTAAKTAEIGYWLDEAHQGHGYMTRAVAALQEFATENLACTHLEIHADVDNTRSRAVAERAGYVLQEIRPQAMISADNLADMAVYARDF